MTVRELVTAFERVFGQPGAGHRGSAASGRRRRRVRQRRPVRASCSTGGPSCPSTTRSRPRWPGATSARRSWATSDLLLSVVVAWRSRRSRWWSTRRCRPRPPTVRSTRPASGRCRPLAGRVVIDPGHQLGNHNFPRKINRLVPAGGFKKPCNTTGTADQRRLPGGDVHLAGRAAAPAPARALGARVLLTRHSNSQDRWGPCVDVRGRAGNRLPADLKISIHGDGSLRRGRPRLPRDRADRPRGRGPTTSSGRRRRLARSTRAALRPAGFAGRELHRRRRRPRLPLRPRHAQPLRHADRDGRARQHAQPATPTDDPRPAGDVRPRARGGAVPFRRAGHDASRSNRSLGSG